MKRLNPEPVAAGEDTIILGLDPGTGKCGLAVLSRCQGVLHQEIASVQQLAQIVPQLVTQYSIEEIGVGNRTGSPAIQDTLKRSVPNTPVAVVSEEMTSMLARRRYWEANPPRGLARLIPQGLRVAPRPLDDYAALIIAERLLAAKATQQ